MTLCWCIHNPLQSAMKHTYAMETWGSGGRKGILIPLYRVKIDLELQSIMTVTLCLIMELIYLTGTSEMYKVLCYVRTGLEPKGCPCVSPVCSDRISLLPAMVGQTISPFPTQIDGPIERSVHNHQQLESSTGTMRWIPAKMFIKIALLLRKQNKARSQAHVSLPVKNHPQHTSELTAVAWGEVGEGVPETSNTFQSLIAGANLLECGALSRVRLILFLEAFQGSRKCFFPCCYSPPSWFYLFSGPTGLMFCRSSAEQAGQESQICETTDLCTDPVSRSDEC